jgi:hypothetical protein
MGWLKAAAFGALGAVVNGGVVYLSLSYFFGPPPKPWLQ